MLAKNIQSQSRNITLNAECYISKLPFVPDTIIKKKQLKNTNGIYGRYIVYALMLHVRLCVYSTLYVRCALKTPTPHQRLGMVTKQN